MRKPVSARPILSGGEVEEAIASMSDAGWHRLNRVAKRYSKGVLNAGDLLHEAFLSSLEGRRKCPTDVDIVRFLAETIRSLASSRFKSAARHPELNLVEDVYPYEEAMPSDTYCDPANIEETMISDQEAERIRTAVLSLFQDDDVALTIVEGDMDGIPREELCELTGLDGTAYDSKRRLIRRRIDRAFPEGWKS